MAYVASSRTIVLTPHSHLRHHTTYRVVVKAVGDLAGNLWDQKPAKTGPQPLTLHVHDSLPQGNHGRPRRWRPSTPSPSSRAPVVRAARRGSALTESVAGDGLAYQPPHAASAPHRRRRAWSKRQ